MTPGGGGSGETGQGLHLALLHFGVFYATVSFSAGGAGFIIGLGRRLVFGFCGG